MLVSPDSHLVRNVPVLGIGYEVGNPPPSFRTCFKEILILHRFRVQVACGLKCVSCCFVSLVLLVQKRKPCFTDTFCVYSVSSLVSSRCLLSSFHCHCCAPDAGLQGRGSNSSALSAASSNHGSRRQRVRVGLKSPETAIPLSKEH